VRVALALALGMGMGMGMGMFHVKHPSQDGGGDGDVSRETSQPGRVGGWWRTGRVLRGLGPLGWVYLGCIPAEVAL